MTGPLDKVATIDQIERIRAPMRRNPPDEDSKPVGEAAGTLSTAGIERLRHRSILSFVIAPWLFCWGFCLPVFIEYPAYPNEWRDQQWISQ